MIRLVTFCFALILVAGEAYAEGFRIRPHVQNLSQTGVTLIWETETSGVGSIHYGAEGTELDGRVQEENAATLHRLRIEGLEAETAYTYRIEAGDDTQQATFTTAPGTEREIVFVVLGDSRRWGTRWHDTGMDEHVRQWNADLYLTMGDLVVDGHQYEQWPEHFERFEELTQSKWFVTARGNHEGSQIRDTENDWFAKYHELPGGEPYAAFDWGNTHFVLISYESTGREKDWSSSAEWLDGHLDSVDKPYTVVAHHFPVYCTGYASTDLSRKEPGKLAVDFRNVLDKHNVTLDASGHTHIYERHYPLRANKRDDRNGTWYVVNGGDINGNYPDWWTAVGDDNTTTSKPTYTVYLAKDDRIISRTFAWSKVEERIVQIDYFVIWQDESIPRGVLNGLTGKEGAELAEAIETLGAMLYAPAAEALLPYIGHDDAPVRYAAAKSISLIANESIADEVFALLDHADPRIAAYMARALEAASPETMMNAIAKAAVDGDVSSGVRFHLVGALQFHAPPERCTKAMLSILGDRQTDPKVRRRAAHALGRTATKADAKGLTNVVKHEEDRYVMMTLGYTLNVSTRNRIRLSANGDFAQSKPGERREFIKKWLKK